MRAIASVDPPAANGTIKVMGLAGYSADTGITLARSAHNAATVDMNVRVIDAPPGSNRVGAERSRSRPAATEELI
jgi:hypothetical protein